MMDLKFLVCEEKNDHVLLPCDAVLHSHILKKLNKIAAFEAALVGDWRTFQHEHAMARGRAWQLLEKAAGYFTGRTVTSVSGSSSNQLANEALPNLGTRRSSLGIALESKACGVSDVMSAAGLSPDHSPPAR